jgi:hypothetical protein
MLGVKRLIDMLTVHFASYDCSFAKAIPMFHAVYQYAWK